MNSDVDIFSGCIPALMTPCYLEWGVTPKPDYERLVSTAETLINEGMRAVVYCGSMGDWPLLSDRQRKEGVKRLCEEGIPVIVGTGAQNTRDAVAHAEHAKAVGARGLMLIPRVLSRGSSHAAQKAHFASILQAAKGLPAIIYNSPYYGFETKAQLFFELRSEFDWLVGFKEFGGAKALNDAAEHITFQEKGLVLLVGVDTQVFHGYVNCGAKGTITGIGNVFPKEVLHLISLCEKAAKGDHLSRRLAWELSEALSVLSGFDEGPDLVLFYKYLMFLKGHQGFDLHFNETDALTNSQMHFASSHFNSFKKWWANWKKETAS